ncbi:DegT/DnrJ/EryC1/StrS family aminotransferase [Halobellus inordinatus]|uniref:DegT/DnrJ/EryC1/StrS family aminotransferase n=1 Tax=Halobellus inordinatus TaxID=1126236 RepID=UPI00210BC6FC|nr:DegT/DnrJ/EryC1/StrS family aminotransferase [Halobellus inordinatus]
MSDRIPLIEPVVGDQELENVREVLESGYMTQGPFAEEFEEKFTELCDATHAITVTSCTTGLELALEAYDIGDGDQVVIPDFTHPATGNAVEHVGAEAVLVDVDRETYNIDTDAVRDAMSDDTAAIMPVSWGGQPLDHKPLQAIADEYDVPIIEDAACGAGAEFEGHAVGSQFDVSVFSFHPRKVLTTGEGGMITTDDDEAERAMRSIKNFGTDPSGDGFGFFRKDATNFRFSDILAAVGVAQMEKRADIVGRRREIAALYDDLLAEVEGVTAPAVVEGGTHNYQSYCVYIEAGDDNLRDDLIDTLGESGIETQIGTYALSDTEAFEDAKGAETVEISVELQNNLLTLPISHSMDEADQRRVVDELSSAIDELTA